jgi:methyl-accepting chemotaxis protein
MVKLALPSTATDVPALIQLRRLASRGFAAALWVMVALNGLVSMFSGMDVRLAVTVSLASAVVGTIACMKDPFGLFGRLVIAVCLMNDYDILIYATSYTPWQLDAHMLYFMVAALLLTYFCWVTLLVACLHTAIQHLSFNILLPFFLYPNGTDWVRFLYHATLLITQLIGTGYLAIRVHRMFSDGHRMLADVQAASAEAAVLRQTQDAERTRLQAEARATVNKLADDFESHMSLEISQVASAATELHATAQAMFGTAERASERAGAVTAASNQASGNVQTVAAAAEELVASVGEINRQITQSAAAADKAANETQHTQTMVKALADGAERIGQVVQLINGIASQTNLLALNATIEAARAGDAGKGFAVVASEVKTLASQTAKATDEIGTQISQIQAATRDAVAAIGAITTTIGQVSQTTAAIAAAVEEQGSATKEIARNIQQAAVGTQQVSHNIVEVDQAAAETGEGARNMLAAAGDLSRRTESLSSEVGSFLAGVRAA